MSQEKIYRGELHIVDRASLTMNGVTNIDSFDEEYVSLSSELGKIGIEGKNLKIESLKKDSGEIEIKGSINGVFFSEKKAKEGLFSKLFK